jgi:hypothetical protein
MEDRELILSMLPKAGRKSRLPLAQPPLPTHSADELWEEFGIRLNELGGRIATREDAEVILARPHLLDHESAEILGLRSGGEPIWDAEVGVTTADLAIAETGSLILATGPHRTRLISLCPVLHLVLVPRDRIVASMAEAFARLSDRTTVMITGPSRTADIEGVLVRGVHGPGDIVVVPI